MSDGEGERVICFVGLGQMGLAMAQRLQAAGYRVRGVDLFAAQRDALIQAGGTAFADAREAAEGADTLIAMLPTGGHVREMLVGERGVAPLLRPGSLIIDMSSSAPFGTRELAAELRERDLRFIDAPVSGGVRRAMDGTLAIMAGGEKADIESAEPILSAMGHQIFCAGPIGAGHATKALNNYVSAAGLIAACEATIVATRFGIEPDIFIDILNSSTGRNNSTEVKLKQFIISEAYNSGFSMGLMNKDLLTAQAMADDMQVKLPAMEAITAMWKEATGVQPALLDHTEIFRFLEKMEERKDEKTRRPMMAK